MRYHFQSENGGRGKITSGKPEDLIKWLHSMRGRGHPYAYVGCTENSDKVPQRHPNDPIAKYDDEWYNYVELSDGSVRSEDDEILCANCEKMVKIFDIDNHNLACFDWFFCDACGASFNYEEDLEAHYQKCMFECEICESFSVPVENKFLFDLHQKACSMAFIKRCDCGAEWNIYLGETHDCPTPDITSGDF